MNPSSHQLVFHGAVVLLIGLLCGTPYVLSAKRGAPEHVVRSWLVAHALIPMGGVLMLAIAALLPSLHAAAWVQSSVAILLVVSGYAFCLSLPLAAIFGRAGASAQAGISVKFVNAGKMVGALGSTAAAVLFLYAAYASL